MQLRHPFVTIRWSIGILCWTLSTVAAERPPRITDHPSNWTVPKNDPVTLKCNAEGDPDPFISWYKNGLKIEPSPHRVLLPTGSLFFLRVSQSKKETDAGVYWCEASNHLGRARSHEVNLRIAFLREDFRTSPSGGRVIAGERAELSCIPPRGHPPPKLKWTKDGNSISYSDRIYAIDGQLTIRETLQTDEGRYACIATNIVGSRISGSTVLAVLVRPFFVRLPDDVAGITGTDVRLECRAGGVPKPNVLWRRHDGRMPVGRARLADDNALVINSLATGDAGVYICQAENVVATVVANATLSVKDPPRLIQGPTDLTILTNKSKSLSCTGRGSPTPIVLWTISGRPQPLGVGWKSNWASIDAHGALQITAPGEEYGGPYACMLLSESGGLKSTAWLTIIEPAHTPPPAFSVKPTNQTLPSGQPATIYCRAVGPPKPKISWIRGATPVRTDNSQVQISAEGDLHFSDLSYADSGEYTCLAESDSGKSQVTVSVLVTPSSNQFHTDDVARSPKPAAFPKAPSRPKVTSLTNATATLSWSPKLKKKRRTFGVASSLTYNLEVSTDGGPWTVVATGLTRQRYVAPLVPDARHIFIARSVNSIGVSPPSQWSPLMVGGRTGVAELDKQWNDSALNLTSVLPVSSTSLKIMWQAPQEDKNLDGLYVHYRSVKPVRETTESSGSYIHSFMKPAAVPADEYVPWDTITVLNAGASSYVVSALKPDTIYQVFLVPFLGAQAGPPTKLLTNVTLQDAPSGPPTEVRVERVNSSSVTVHWGRPVKKHIHGPITGYNVVVFLNESSLYLNTTLNSSSLALPLRRLVAGSYYTVLVRALSKNGSGPPSVPFGHRAEIDLLNPLANRHSGGQGVVGEAWFIVLMGGAMFVVLFVLVILLYIRRSQHKSSKLPKLNGSVTKTSNLANFYGGENLWPEHGWQGLDDDLKSDHKTFSTMSQEQRDLLSSLAPEYAEIDSLGTFGGARHAPVDDSGAEAYASASVLANCNDRRSKQINEAKFLSLSQKGSMANGKPGTDRAMLSQELLNNTDRDDKQMNNSKRPFFIETSPMPMGFPHTTPVSNSIGGGVPSPYATSHCGKFLGRPSPYSVNTFSSQPHIMKNGITLTLQNFAPPPPAHPPPAQNHLRQSFTRTKTMEELPYACYSATQVVTPTLPRATSLEGRGSPYAVSSPTYQSIEGLTDGLLGMQDEDDCGHRCRSCGSKASTMSKRSRTPKSCRYGYSGRPQRLRMARSNTNESLLQKTMYERGHNNHSCSPGGAGNQCSRIPVSCDSGRLPLCSYAPNFYGWMSPPGSPAAYEFGKRRLEPFEVARFCDEGSSVYGGSIRSDAREGEYAWGRDNSVYESSPKSTDPEGVRPSNEAVTEDNAAEDEADEKITLLSPTEAPPTSPRHSTPDGATILTPEAVPKSPSSRVAEDGGDNSKVNTSPDQHVRSIIISNENEASPNTEAVVISDKQTKL